MVRKNKILCGVLCVVLIVWLQEKAFSHIYPLSEVFTENTSDVFFISPEQEISILHNRLQNDADASNTISTSDSKPILNANTDNYLDRSWSIDINGITDSEYTIRPKYLDADINDTESEIAMGIDDGNLPWEKGSTDASNNELSTSGTVKPSITFSGITAASPTIDNITATDNPICIGSSTTINTTVTGDPVLTYSWTPSATLDLTDPANPIASPTSTTTYQVTVTDGNGLTASDQIEITVVPQPSVSPIADQEFCLGENTPVIPLSGTPANVLYNITGGSSVGLPDQSGVNEIPSFTAQTVGTATITITPYTANCTGDPVNFTIVVQPLPNIQTPISQLTICSGETTNIALSSSTPGTTFTWNVVSNGDVTGASDGNGNNISQTLENKTQAISEVIYQITATANGCEGATRNFTVTVHPEVTANITGATTICQEDASPQITFTAAGGTAPYTFSYTVNDGPTQQVIANSGTTATVDVPTNVDGDFDYTLTAVAGSTNCPYPKNETVRVTVNPKPYLSSTLTPSGICSNQLFNYTPTSDVPGTTYNWTRDAVPGISNSAASGTDDPDESLENTTNDPIAVTYTYELTSPDGCTNTQDVVVMVTPTPSLTSSTNLTEVCSDETFSYTPTSDVAGTSFSWTRDAITGISNSAASGTGNPNEVLINTTSSTITVNYIYSLESNDCENPVTYTIPVDVLPAPNVTASASPTPICPGEPVNLSSSSDIESKGNLKATISWSSNPAGFTSSDPNPIVNPTGTTTYTVTYTDPTTGCSGSASTTVNVYPQPDATIHADYCIVSPKIRLTTGAFESYDWSPIPYGETNGKQYIDIDIAGVYTVTVTDINGCTDTKSINVSNEYVTNGSFELGNTGFTTPPASNGNQYEYVVDGAGNTELNPEGFYGIGTNAQNYHSNFWGVDHTSGTGNFMIVNGFPGEPQPIVWQQTITNIQPNTTYYFSAWAISLNSAGNDAQLQFSINGTQLGKVADLTTIPGVSDNSNSWHPEGRFYGTWNSGSNTSAVLAIVDLQTAAGGNDFGIDDISFGILDPAPATIAPAHANDICAGDTIKLYANVSGGKEPITYLWTGPNGFSSTEENPTIPNAGTEYSGTYTLQITDWYGCDIDPQTVDVTVYPTALVDAGPDQPRGCSGDAVFYLNGIIGGSASSATWTTSSGTGTFADPNSPVTTYTASEADIAAGSVTLTLTTDDPAGQCSENSDDLLITIHESPELTVNVGNPPCHGETTGWAEAEVINGTPPYLYTWSNGETTKKVTGLTVGSYSVTVTDQNGCTDFQEFDITEPAPLAIYPASFTPPSCYGGNDGTATINVSGGTEPYIYEWNDAPGNQTTQTATGLEVGTYMFTVTDINGCNITTDFILITEPGPPTFDCSELKDIVVQADAGETHASNVVTDYPDLADLSCQTLAWKMTFDGNVIASGDDTDFPATYTFSVGTTTIGFTTTNLMGDELYCEYNVVVTPNDPPSISCTDPPSATADAGECSTDITISLPTVTTGNTITWTWEMTGATTGSGTGPIPDPYTFNVGTTEILWTATNVSGSDQCTQSVEVTDSERPQFVAPSPVEECVEAILLAEYNSATTDINPNRPDYYLFEAASTELDLNTSNFTDNCDLTCRPVIRWRIDFSDGTALPSTDPATFISGQPSTYGSDIRFPGDGVNFTSLTHTITYWIVDCHNNVSDPVTTTVTVNPRPRITKN